MRGCVQGVCIALGKQAWEGQLRAARAPASPHCSLFARLRHLPQAVLEDALAAAAAGEPISGYAWVRQGHAACLLGRSVYVWGGIVKRDGRKTGQLMVLNLDTCGWRVRGSRWQEAAGGRMMA